MSKVIDTYRRLATERKTLGFWIYLMTDVLLFATLFATYAVLHGGTANGPSSQEIFELPNVLVETFALLTSSFTVGLAILAATDGRKKLSVFWLVVTFLLGVTFLVMELTEFHGLVVDGHSWTQSGFLSAFFTLVATHGAHITVGLIWMVVMIIRVLQRNLKDTDVARLALLSLFWHFLDIVWIFIFTFVYLIGSLS